MGPRLAPGTEIEQETTQTPAGLYLPLAMLDLLGNRQALLQQGHGSTELAGNPQGLTEERRDLRRELETARTNHAEVFAAKESLVAEVERLRRINSELVDTHNKGVVDRSKLKTELERRADVIFGVTENLRNAWESLEVLNAYEGHLEGEARTGNGSVKRPERVGEDD